MLYVITCRSGGGTGPISAASVIVTAYGGGRRGRWGLRRDEGAGRASPDAWPAPVAGLPVIAQLQQLADLKAQGILSDEEFAAAKAKLLG